MYFYRASNEERINVGYLVFASPECVYAWLKDNWEDPGSPEIFDVRWFQSKRRVIEYLLWRRNNFLIDHGLARYGTDIKIIQRVYDRGNTSIRLAALVNPYASVRIRQAGDIIKSGPYNMVKCLLGSEYISSKFIVNLFTRKGEFEDIDDERFQDVILAVHGNKRLNTPYNSLYMDGWNEFIYREVFSAAWELTRFVPITQQWASILWVLLENCQPPVNFQDVEAVLERWRIDQPVKDLPRWHERSDSFNLRVCIADLVLDDEKLRTSDDPACRMAFYRKFSPYSYKNWQSFLERDGEEFVHAVLQNKKLWQTEELRSQLNTVCWEAPDPRSTMDFPNDFRAYEQRFRKENPEWFVDEDKITVVSKDALGERLEKIEIILENLLDHKNDRFD